MLDRRTPVLADIALALEASIGDLQVAVGAMHQHELQLLPMPAAQNERGHVTRFASRRFTSAPPSRGVNLRRRL